MAVAVVVRAAVAVVVVMVAGAPAPAPAPAVIEGYQVAWKSSSSSSSSSSNGSSSSSSSNKAVAVTVATLLYHDSPMRPAMAGAARCVAFAQHGGNDAPAGPSRLVTGCGGGAHGLNTRKRTKIETAHNT